MLMTKSKPTGLGMIGPPRPRCTGLGATMTP